MRKILLIVLFFSAGNNLHSQDTVNAKFFPMHVGNYYVYKNQDLFFTNYFTASITDDTLIGGKKYFKLQGFPHLENSFYRYDSTNGNLLKFKLGKGCSNYPNDVIIDSLASSVNNQILGCEEYSRVCSERLDSSITFIHDWLIYNRLTYKIGLGIFSHCSAEPPPCSGSSILQGAIINGVLWGDTTVTYLEQISLSIPEKINLHQNYPNPFNPSTLIKFDIPKTSNVRVSIYDNTGRLVETIVNKSLSYGTYEVQWNAGSYPSGVYFYRLETDGFSQTKKMLLVR